MSREQKQAATKLGSTPKVDYSLKEGQTITVKIAVRFLTTVSGSWCLRCFCPDQGWHARLW